MARQQPAFSAGADLTGETAGRLDWTVVDEGWGRRAMDFATPLALISGKDCSCAPKSTSWDTWGASQRGA